MILLDATIEVRVHNHAFRARLDNGHNLIVFRRANAGGEVGAPGDRVRVKLSPFDMTVGEWITDRNGIES